MSNPDTPTPAGLTAARLAEISRAVLDLEGRAFDFGECPIDDAAHFDSETEEARNRVLGLVAEMAAALDAATAALREIVSDAPEYLIEEDYTTCEDAYQAGLNAQHFACAEIARRALGHTAARPTDAEARA